VSSSRAILYASSGDDFAQAARQEAMRTRDLLKAAAQGWSDAVSWCKCAQDVLFFKQALQVTAGKAGRILRQCFGRAHSNHRSAARATFRAHVD